MAVGQGLAGVFCKTRTGHGSAGAYLCQPAHCPGKDRSASTGTNRSIAGAFHRDASCWRARQRQDHIAAQYRRKLVRQKILSVIDERRELLPGMRPARRWMFLPGSPRDKQCRWHWRTPSPQVILLDELGGLDEVTALEQGLFSGVNLSPPFMLPHPKRRPCAHR